MRNFLTNYTKNQTEDERFMLYLTIGNLYERCGFNRKKNCFYFMGSTIYLDKKS